MDRGSRKTRFVACAAITACLAIAAARANGFSATSFIAPQDLVAFQQFGAAVAASGDVMAVGTAQPPYAVYVYRNANGPWNLQARLTSPTGSTTDRFGSSLALEGGTLVVGAANARVAYVFGEVSGAWIEQAVLAPDGGSGASFGGSSLNGMAVSGNTIVVGAPSESNATGNSGSVYVFTNTGGAWTQQARIVPADPGVVAFGTSVALQGDTLAVGAPFSASPAVFNPGTAFVFAREDGAWSQQARLDPVDDVAFGLYGLCVALDGNTVVVGAERPSEAEIFVNDHGTWGLQQILAGDDDSDFGTSVSILGDTVMVTAYEDVSPIGFQSGVAHLYKRGGSTWTERLDLLMAPEVDGIPGPAQDRQRFGNFAAMTRSGSVTRFVFGSPTYSPNFLDPAQRALGAVYTATLN